MVERDIYNSDRDFFSGALYSLREFADFPFEMRSLTRRALFVAAKHAPTEMEWIVIELETPGLKLTYGGEQYDEIYGLIADLFVKTFDPSWKGDRSSLSPEMIKHRERFYRMVRPLSSEKILKGIHAIHESRLLFPE